MQSVSAQRNFIAHQSKAHVNKQEQQPAAQQVPVPAGNHAWQQQQQHSMMTVPHQPAAATVSGVFADDDDFDDIWMSNHVLQAQVVAPVRSAQQQQSIMTMPVIDLSGSPARKKAKP